MRTLSRIEPKQATETSETLAKAFAAIERNARLAGRHDVLMELDRIPDAFLGPSHTYTSGSEAIALGAAFAALKAIKQQLAGQHADSN
jgi:hypothetical protein